MSFEKIVEASVIDGAIRAFSRKRDEFVDRAKDNTHNEEKIVDGVAVRFVRKDAEAAVFESLASFCDWQISQLQRDLASLGVSRKIPANR